MTSPQSRPGGRSARVRDAVLRAALAELAQEGYGALSLERVAQRAGVNRSSVYRRWGTREALVLDAVAQRAETHVAIPETGSLRSDLLELAQSVIANNAAAETASIIRAFIAEAPRDSSVAQVGREFWAARFAADRTVVTRAIERGELPASTDADQVIEALLGPIYFRQFVSARPFEADYVIRLVDRIVDGLGGVGSAMTGRKRAS